jgi:hypothetical protein
LFRTKNNRRGKSTTTARPMTIKWMLRNFFLFRGRIWIELYGSVFCSKPLFNFAWNESHRLILIGDVISCLGFCESI